jgi:quinol monooxygenase YgiN
MTQHMRLEYRLRDDVDPETYLPLLGEFVSNMKAHDPSHDYTTYRDTKDPRHFVHVGHFAPDVIPGMQAQAWFKQFTAHMRTLTAAPPDVAMLSQVASTR